MHLDLNKIFNIINIMIYLLCAVDHPIIKHILHAFYSKIQVVIDCHVQQLWTEGTEKRISNV